MSSKFFAGSVTQRIAVKAKDLERKGSPRAHGVAKEGSSYVDQPVGALMSGCVKAEDPSVGESNGIFNLPEKKLSLLLDRRWHSRFAILVALLSLFRDSHQVYEYFWKIDAQILIFMLSLSIFNYFGRILRWHYFSAVRSASKYHSHRMDCIMSPGFRWRLRRGRLARRCGFGCYAEVTVFPMIVQLAF